ncbi:unnamed protein product [Cylicostephanus goldi]|uniref:Uncharacterized protein n=1 Tax=Cylicostephanus goldi TaxID=71465 RepID=A0A3P6RLJ0_CYLGO|nr:unnamed protein product [Cylicostephanus goldi]
MATEDVVSVDWLDDNKDHVVILDATYDMKVKPDYKEFKQKYYGKFDDLMNIKMMLEKLTTGWLLLRTSFKKRGRISIAM